MFILFKNAEVFFKGKFEEADVLVVYNKIAQVGTIDYLQIKNTGLEIEIIDCKGHYLCPGFIDSQAHLAGGSGENGFLSQPPRILIEECILGGVTTVVGAIGVDTQTKTMSNLYASVRAFREAGMGAYAYSGGYEVPPITLTGSLSTDILYVDEIIGAGETAIADRRAPEPTIKDLARVIVDSYVAGFLVGKSGVTRIHVGEGNRKLKTIREMCEVHEIQYECLYFTHIERSKELVQEGIEIAHKGSFVDFDIQQNDLDVWYKYYLEQNGPLTQLSFSTDAGLSSSVELWAEFRKCIFHHDLKLENLIPHVTSVPAKALKFIHKGSIAKGFDADLLVIDKKNLELQFVMVQGKFFYQNTLFKYADQLYTPRRKVDWYGIRR